MINVKEQQREEKRLLDIRGEITGQIRDLTHEIDSVLGEADRERDSFREMRSSLKTKHMQGRIDAINHIVQAVEGKRKELAHLKISKQNPYFAGLCFAGCDLLIGQFSVFNKQKDAIDLYVNDWRAPISSLFYDYELGEASYKVDGKTIEGNISGKKQYKIEDGKLLYFFDTALNIQDEILQETLAKSSSEHMKTIVATIQKEQNQVIRRGAQETLVVQGVAGSGKTSIALHRIAYLLYNNRHQLSSKNILIFSPSKVFSNYIEDVLPSLGEARTEETTFDDILKQNFAGVFDVERRFEMLEDLLAGNHEREKELRKKGSFAFFTGLTEFLEKFTADHFVPKILKINQREYSASQVFKLYANSTGFSFYEKMQRVAEGIAGLILVTKALNNEQEEVLKRQIIAAATRMLKQKNIIKIYQAYLSVQGLKMQNTKTVLQEDAHALLYIKNFLFGASEQSHIQHLIIDEMQDYSPMQFAIINQMYHCPKTILGDVWQRVDGQEGGEGLVDILFSFPGSSGITLNKSYRASFELCSFTEQFVNLPKLEKVQRHGDKPRLIKVKNGEMQKVLLAEIAHMQKKHKNIGIITKTQVQANDLYRSLKGEFNAHILSPRITAFQSGVTVSPAYMAKGLEFDAVVLYDVSEENYKTELDKQNLYVGATRALHALSLLYENTLSHFVKTAGCDTING